MARQREEENLWASEPFSSSFALVGGFSGRGGPFYGTGYYGGGLGLVLLIVIILVVLGRI